MVKVPGEDAGGVSLGLGNPTACMLSCGCCGPGTSVWKPQLVLSGAEKQVGRREKAHLASWASELWASLFGWALQHQGRLYATRWGVTKRDRGTGFRMLPSKTLR